MTIHAYMTHDHRRCDDLFTEMENRINDSRWAEVSGMLEAFEKAMLHHFAMEEKVIFPKFNECAQGGCNPTQVMIMEHDQMRRLFSMMREAMEKRNQDQLLGLSENLMILMQQHNMKEEQVMYNMADNALNADEVIASLEAMDG